VISLSPNFRFGLTLRLIYIRTRFSSILLIINVSILSIEKRFSSYFCYLCLTFAYLYKNFSRVFDPSRRSWHAGSVDVSRDLAAWAGTVLRKPCLAKRQNCLLDLGRQLQPEGDCA